MNTNRDTMLQIDTEKSDTLDTKACDLAPQQPDIAQGTVHGTAENSPYTEAENRTVLRKIDWFLLPWVLIGSRMPDATVLILIHLAYGHVPHPIRG